MMYEPKLRHELVNDERISLWTESMSCCELDLVSFSFDVDSPLVILRERFSFDGLVYWFSRLKAKESNRGDGTYLMTCLCEILDNRGVLWFESLWRETGHGTVEGVLWSVWVRRQW